MNCFQAVSFLCCESSEPTLPIKDLQRLTLAQSATPATQMNDFPDDLIRYELLTFLTSASAIKLARSSRSFFTTLRLKIHRTEFVSTDLFFWQQTRLQQLQGDKQIGLCCAVSVPSKVSLIRLLKYVVDVNVSKSCHLLHLKINFNESLRDVSIPQSVHTLTFAPEFNQSLVGCTLPASLRKVEFGHWFNQSLVGCTLPERLHTLIFGECYDQPLVDVTLPPSLEILQFGWNFNQSIMTLPQTLRTLTFGHWFNRPLSLVTLPAKLTTLTFGYDFNQSLIGIQFNPNLIIRKYGRNIDIVFLPPGLQIMYL